MGEGGGRGGGELSTLLSRCCFSIPFDASSIQKRGGAKAPVGYLLPWEHQSRICFLSKVSFPIWAIPPECAPQLRSILSVILLALRLGFEPHYRCHTTPSALPSPSQAGTSKPRAPHAGSQDEQRPLLDRSDTQSSETRNPSRCRQRAMYPAH